MDFRCITVPLTDLHKPDVFCSMIEAPKLHLIATVVMRVCMLQSSSFTSHIVLESGIKRLLIVFVRRSLIGWLIACNGGRAMQHITML
jgi:hypothetical protein